MSSKEGLSSIESLNPSTINWITQPKPRESFWQPPVSLQSSFKQLWFLVYFLFSALPSLLFRDFYSQKFLLLFSQYIFGDKQDGNCSICPAKHCNWEGIVIVQQNIVIRRELHFSCKAITKPLVDTFIRLVLKIQFL